MKLIQHITVGSGGAASITFSSIPGTFTDLYVTLSLRSDRGGNTTDVPGIRINGSSANLSSRALTGSGLAVSSRTDTNGRVGVMNGADSTANTFSSFEVYLPNYTSAANKSISANSVQEGNITEAFQEITAGLWSQTAAITSVSFAVLFGTNFVQHSSASLYGILRGSDGITTAT